jgi:hypothetical protein
MRLRKKPVYPSHTRDTYEIPLDDDTSIHTARDVTVKHLVDNSRYTYDELRHSLGNNQIFIDHNSGWHLGDCWELILRVVDLCESNASFNERVQSYRTEDDKYNTWYEANKEKIAHEEKRLAEEKELRAIRRATKSEETIVKRRIADIAKLEKQLAELKGERL